MGENPATPIRRECMTFEEYWNSLTTNPADFAAAYSDARKKRAGSADSSATSERRKTFEGALGLNCLVTNVCSYPAFPGDDIPKEHRGAKGTGYKILSALLEMVQPRAILFHGAEAAKFAKRKFKIKLDIHALPEAQNSTVEPWYASDPVLLFASVHLGGARRFGEDEMDRRMQLFGHKISTALRELF